MLTKSYNDYNIQALIPEALFTLDYREKFVYVNKIAGALLGREPEELIGKHIWTEFPDALTQPVYQAYQKAVKDQQHVYLEEYNAVHDRWFENHIYQSQEGISICFRDITERKEKENALKTSEERYKSILAASPEGITISDLEGRLQIVSPMALSMFGYLHEKELLGKMVTDFLIPEDRELAAGNIALMFQGVLTGSCEYHGRRTDGTVFDIEANAEFVRNSNGEPIQIVFIVRDISKRKRAEEALRDSEALYRSILKYSPDDITVMDLEGRILMFSPNALTLFGYSVEDEILGRLLTDFVAPEDAGHVLQNMMLLHQGVNISTDEYIGIRKDGTRFPIEANADLIRDPEGNPVKMIIAIRDISVRKREEQALIDSENKYRELVENSPDAIVVYTEGKVVFVNREALSLMRAAKKEELIGRSVLDFVHPDYRSFVIERMMQATKEGKILPLAEEKFMCLDGAEIDVEVKTLPIIHDGKPAVQLIIRDITAGKQAEQLKQEAVDRLMKISSRIPGVIYQYRLRPDGTSCFPYASDGIKEVYNVTPEEVKEDASKVFSVIHADDLEEVASSIHESAQNLSAWKQEYRVQFADGNIHTLFGNAIPQKEADGSVLWHGYISDITERKQAEELIRENENLYRSILKASPDDITITDLEGNILLVSPSALTMWGYDIDHEITGRNIIEFVAPDEVERVLDTVALLHKGGNVNPGEYEGIRKDGTSFPIEVNADFIRDKNGLPVKMILSIRDITERKLAEEVLNASQQMTRQIINTIPVRVFWKDRDLKYMGCNEIFAKDAGFNVPAEVVGKDDFTMAWCLQADLYRSDDRKVIDTGISKLNIEEIQTTPDGKIITLLTNKIPLRNSKAEIIGVLGTYVDISERKQAEEVLRESEEKWSKLVSIIPDFIALHDLDNNYLFLNHFAEGFSENDLIGKKGEDFISEDSKEIYRLHFKQCIEKNQTEKCEFIAFGSNKEFRAYENYFIPIVDKEQHVNSVMVIAKDITERKQAEETIKTKAEQLERTGEIAKVGGWEFDLRTKERYWSLETCRILDIDPPITSVFESSLNYSFYIPESFQIIQDAVNEGIANGKPYDLELQMKTAKGRSIWVREQGDFLMEGGKIVKLYGVMQDITERKQAELSLQLAHQSYFDIFHTVSEAIYILDETGTFIDVNKGAAEMYRFTREELIGQSPATVAAPGQNDLAYIEQLLQSVSVNGSSVRFDFWAVRANGEIFPKDVIVSKGKYFGKDVLIATARDMTESKKAEQALRESEHLLNESQRVSRIGSYKLDITNGLWESSLELKNIFGINTKGKQDIELWESFIHPEYKQEMHEYLLQEVFGKKQRFDKEYKVVNQVNGKEYWVHGIGDLSFNEKGVPVTMMGTIQDITEKKEAEDVIHAQEKLYRALIENSNDGVVILDGWGKFRYIAPSMKTVLGYDEEELLNTGLLDITHPDDYDKSVEIYKEVLASSGLYNPEFIPRIKHKNGEWRSIAGAMNNLMKDPLIHGVIGNFRDVTEQVLAEKAIKESEIKYRSLIDNAGDAIAIYDARGNVLDVNITGLKMLGYGKEEILEKKVEDFFTKDEMEEIPITYDKLRPGESSLKQRHFISKDGSLVLTEVRSQVLPDGNLLSIVRDLTERTEAQEKLKKEKELSDSIINRLPGIFYLYDEDGHFIRWNKNFEKVSGYSTEEIKRMKPVDFYGEKHDSTVRNRINSVPDKESPDSEVELLTKEGKEIPFFISSFTIDYEGKRCLTGIGIDLSSKRKAEMEIAEKTAQLENLSDNLPETMMYQIALELNGEIHFTYLSKAVEKLIGKTAEEVIDNSFLLYEVILEEDRQLLAEAEQASFLNMAPMNIDVRMLQSNGTIRWMNIRSVPRRLMDGRVIWDGVNSDITERKNAEEQLRISSEEYASLVNAIDGIVWEVDAKTKQFTFVSKQAEQLLGYPLEQWTDEYDFWPNHIFEKDREWVIDYCFRNDLEKRAYDFQYRMVAADGRIVWLHKSVSIVFENEEAVKLRGIMVDISSQKQVEEDLRQSLEDLEVIYQLSSSLSQAASVDEILNDAMSALEKTIHPDRVAILLFDADDVLRFKAWKGLSAEYRNKVEGHSPWSRTAEYPVPIFISSTEEEPGLKQLYAVFKKEGIEAVGFIPIIQNGVLLGKFMLYNNTKRQFTQKESQLAQTISSHVANAIERKNAEKAISDYRFALNQSSIVDVSDSRGVIQFANENFCNISGYSLEELKGKDHRILKSGFHSKEHYKNLWTTITNGHVWRSEVKNKAKDGSFYWVDSTIVPFLDDNGKPFQFITIRSDITKRKEAETQILNTLERYDILSKATSDTIWDWDMPNNVIIYNQGIVNNFGYKVARVKKVKEWWDMNIHPEDRHKVSDVFEKAFSKRKTVIQVEYRYRCADGSYRNILDRAFVIYDRNKKPVRMIGSMQDITNEKEFAVRLEKEVIDAQEREWNQIGMELHDNVNQILAASMLLMGLGKEKMERGQNAASIIYESEKHVGEAIAEIRRLSHQLAPVSVDNLSLEQVFESLIETVNVNNQFKVKMQMKALKDIKIPHKLQINLYRILQAQLNNIVKYANATEVTISIKKTAHYFVFRIADNGVGFDPGAHTSGIGLENINRRAKVFAGEFKLNTSPGKGCEVIVEIPINVLS